MPTGLGGEQLWLSATNDNTGTSTAFNDQSGNGNNGTASGTTVVADTGDGGTYAYSLDGANDYIYGLGQSEWDFINQTGVFSISAWCKSDVIDANNRLVVGSNISSANTGFGLYEAGNTAGPIGHRFDMMKGTSGSPQAQDSTGDTSGFTSWKCVTVTGDGTDLKIYVDGVLSSTSSITLPVTNAQSSPMYIGTYIGSALFYDGLIDDVRIYDRTVTQAEVTHLATSRGIEGSPPVGLGGEKLWLCPTLDNSVADLSGNGNSTSLGSASIVTDGANKHYNDTVTTTASALINDLSPTSWSLWVNNSLNTASTTIDIVVKGTAKILTLRQGGSGNQKFDFVIDGSGGDAIAGSSYTPNPAFRNSWTHVAIVWDGTFSPPTCGSVYIDGTFVYSIEVVSGTVKSDSAFDLSIGSAEASTDDIRLYDRELTQAEITHLATSRGIQGPAQVLNYENTTNVSGVSIQSDVDVDGINLLQTDGDIQGIEIKIKWSNASSWQGCECYVIDPDGSYHYLFSSGSLPFGSGSRVDSMTISSGSFPLSMDGTWEFHLSDQMFNSNTIDEVSTDFEVIQTNMPDTYSEVSWYGGGFYRGGVDLSGNTNHVYPHNSASIVADTGSNGTNAFSFSSSSSQRWSDGIVPDYNSVPKWSVSAWIKAGQTLASKAMIFCNHGYRRGNFQLYQTGDEFGLFLGYYDPAFSFGDAEIITTTNVNITTGSWYNIIATFDGGAATQTNIYVNGASAASSRQTVASGISVLPLNTFAGTAPDQTIGAMKDAAGSTIYYPFDGEIDACRTVNSVYTSDDVSWLSSGRDVAGGPTDFKSYYKTNQSSITGFPNA